MKPLSKHQQATLAKNRGIPVQAGISAMNARGKIKKLQTSLLAMAVVTMMSKPK